MTTPLPPVYVRLIRPEGYEDVHPQLLIDDQNINPAFEPEDVTAEFAALASKQAMVWYSGPPPFPQGQEWFIAETIYGERVVLMSLNEGRERKHTYDFKTADYTHVQAKNIKRWMQFPDCDYVPPEAHPHSPAPTPLSPAPTPLSEEQIEQGRHDTFSTNNPF